MPGVLFDGVHTHFPHSMPTVDSFTIHIRKKYMSRQYKKEMYEQGIITLEEWWHVHIVWDDLIWKRSSETKVLMNGR